MEWPSVKQMVSSAVLQGQTKHLQWRSRNRDPIFCVFVFFLDGLFVVYLWFICGPFLVFWWFHHEFRQKSGGPPACQNFCGFGAFFFFVFCGFALGFTKNHLWVFVICCVVVLLCFVCVCVSVQSICV